MNQSLAVKLGELQTEIYWLLEVNQFRGDDQIISPLFSELNLTVSQILQII